MYITLIGLPLLGAIIGGLGGRYIGQKGSIIITIMNMIFTVILGLFIFIENGLYGTSTYINIGKWINIDILQLNWGLQYDTLTISMILVITIISTIVHIYSSEYMKGDPHINRFMAYLSLFTFFMLILVTGDNIIQLFIGWEGVGLCSYLLINFWFTRIQANKAAMKAIMINRIGDYGISIGMFAIFYNYNTLNFDIIKSIIHLTYDNYIFNIHILSFITFCFLVGVIAKSSQILLHLWLPDAMEGPTPVSALIHAATMVTAGIFLIIRCSTLFEYCPMILSNMLIIGGITALFGGTSALFQNDIKKIIAFSTCSQLGYMIYCCGASNYSISFFHLSNHAYFKALLFLSAGSIIHALFDQQDMRKYGGLLHFLPISYILILIGSIILMGFPFFSGYYSKDILIISSFSLFSIEGHFSFILGNLSAFFTSLYSFRLIYLSFFHQFLNNSRPIFSNIHESSLIYPILPLLFFSLFIGYYSKDLFLNPLFWNNSIIFNYHILDAEFLISFFFKLFPLFLSIFAILLGIFIILNLPSLLSFLFPSKQLNNRTLLMKIYSFFNQKWYFDMLYNHYFLMPILSFGYNITFNLLDKGFIDYFGPSGLSFKINNIAAKIKPSKNESTYSLFQSTFFILIGLFFYLFIYIFSFDWIFFTFFSFFFISPSGKATVFDIVIHRFESYYKKYNTTPNTKFK